MAELPRYQMMGIPVPGMPQLEFAAQREQARLAGGISEGLSRISQFAFKEAAAEAEIKGLQYGAENPVTKEQIDAAMQEGRSPQELFQQRGTSFGDAARKVQAIQLRNELEVKARNDLAIMSAGIDANKVSDLNSIKTTIDGMTAGYANVLRGVDPEQALRFRQSITVAGNSVYAKAAERMAKLHTAAMKDSADLSVQSTSAIISDTFNVEQDPTLVVDRVALERKRVQDIALQVGDPTFYSSTMNSFNKKLIDAVANQAIKMGLKPADTVKAIDSGDLGNLSGLLKGKIIDKELVKDQYLKNLSEQVRVMESTKKLEDEGRKDKSIGYWDDFYKGKLSGDSLISSLRANGTPPSPEQVKSVRKGEGAGPKGSDELIGKLESLADNGQIGENTVDTYAKSGQISWRQANGIKQKIRNNRSDMSQASRFIDFNLGVPDPLTPGLRVERQNAAEVKSELINEENKARLEGRPFDPIATARDLIAKKKSSESFRELQSAEDALKKTLDVLGIKYSKEYTEEDLKKLGVSDNKLRAKVIREMKAARGGL